MVEVVLAVVLQEELEGFLHLVFGGLLAERAPDQNGSAVADVGVNALVRERRHAHVAARGVDGIRQIQPGIDQGAVEVENDEVQIRW